MFYFRFASIWMQKNSDRRVPARKKMIEKAQRFLTPLCHGPASASPKEDN